MMRAVDLATFALLIAGPAAAAQVSDADKKEFMQECLAKATPIAQQNQQARSPSDYCTCALNYFEHTTTDPEWQRLDAMVTGGKPLDGWGRREINKVAAACSKP
jgi:hypothetical protein